MALVLLLGDGRIKSEEEICFVFLVPNEVVPVVPGCCLFHVLCELLVIHLLNEVGDVLFYDIAAVSYCFP